MQRSSQHVLQLQPTAQSQMECLARLKVHNQYVIFCEIRNNKNAKETAKKIYSVYNQGVITDCQVWKCFSKFHSGGILLKDEPKPGCSLKLSQSSQRELVECSPHKSTRELALNLNTYTICRHLKKDKKSKQFERLGSSYS